MEPGRVSVDASRVRMAGTVAFLVSEPADGSRYFSCGKSAVNGLAVSTADSLIGITMPPDDSYVSVTGLSGVFSSGGLYYPIIRLRSSNDITQFAP